MFHTPAHKNTANPPAQTPVGTTQQPRPAYPTEPFTNERFHEMLGKVLLGPYHYAR